METESTPFAELPAALVEEILNRTEGIGDNLLQEFNKVRTGRTQWRKELLDSGLIVTESAFGYPPAPTTCAADGSYAIDRLLTCDMVASVAVAVEGLTPPSEDRHWERPHHLTFVQSEPHHADTATILRSVMMGNELKLAVNAPHDLVMFDGSSTLPIIYFNQALTSAPDIPELTCSREFLDHCVEYLDAYLKFLSSSRSDKHFVAVPKYSTRREIGKRLEAQAAQDDRGLLTLLLLPGELTKPITLEQPGQKWHFTTSRLSAELRPKVDSLAKEIVQKLEQVRVFYYKPHDWLPALRLEVSEAISSNSNRMGIVIQGIKLQCATAAMLEPYPLYLADRTVKSLSRALPTFKQVATQRVAEKYSGDVGEVFFALHGYRSEGGTQ